MWKKSPKRIPWVVLEGGRWTVATWPNVILRNIHCRAERENSIHIWSRYSLHYAKVAEIRILKCPTLTSYFSVVFHLECTKFCIELCELPKNLEKEEEEKNWREKRGKKCKKHEGGVC